MKRLATMILAIMMLASLVACGGRTADTKGAEISSTQKEAGVSNNSDESVQKNEASQSNNPDRQQEENGRSKATEFTFELAEDEERVVENLIFDADVTISGDFGMIVFENCVFNGDIINAAEQFTRVILPEGTIVNGNCVFKNTIKEGTMDTPVPKFISPSTLNIVCEDCIGACVLDGTENSIIFNGETYSMSDVKFFYDADANALVPYEGQEVSTLFVGQWWENGEKVLQLFCE